jgi:hypothetical protein
MQQQTTARVLTIRRREWRRGGDAGERKEKYGATQMLNEQGQKCCLGFDALACGVPEADLLGQGEPYEVIERFVHTEIPAWFERYVTEGRFWVEDLVADDGEIPTQKAVVDKAVQINDDPKLTDAEREEQLVPVLKALGWDVIEFVD